MIDLQENRRHRWQRQPHFSGVLLILQAHSQLSTPHSAKYLSATQRPKDCRNTYVQTNTPNTPTPNLIRRQRRQDSLNHGNLPGFLARNEHRGPAEDVDMYTLAIVHGDADVEAVVERLADEDFVGVGLGMEADESW